MTIDPASIALRFVLAARARQVTATEGGCEAEHSWAWVSPEGKFISVPDHGGWALKNLDPGMKARVLKKSREFLDWEWKQIGFFYEEAVQQVLDDGDEDGPVPGLARYEVQALTPQATALATKGGLPTLSKGWWGPKKDRLSRKEEQFLLNYEDSYGPAFQKKTVDRDSALNRKKQEFWKARGRIEVYLGLRSLAKQELEDAGWLTVSSAYAIGWETFPRQAQLDAFFKEVLKCWKASGLRPAVEKEPFHYSDGPSRHEITYSEALDQFASRQVQEDFFGYLLDGDLSKMRGDRLREKNDEMLEQYDQEEKERLKARPPFFPKREPSRVRPPEKRLPYRRADLSPPLGYPGGPCHVMQRIDDALNGPLEDELIEKVEDAQDLTNTEANKIYKPEADRGATGTQFKKLVLTPHAQYRMDLRGITVPQIRMTLKGFHDHYSKEKSRGTFLFKQLESDLQFTREIKWVDKGTGITLVFVSMNLGGEMAARIITCYRAGEDEGRIERTECGIFTGWAGEYEDSSHLFKPDARRVAAMALRAMNLEFTKPEDVPHRTLAIPGEEYGIPVNDSNLNGGMLTRRTMTGSEEPLLGLW